jgi:hypothetical protein
MLRLRQRSGHGHGAWWDEMQCNEMQCNERNAMQRKKCNATNERNAMQIRKRKHAANPRDMTRDVAHLPHLPRSPHLVSGVGQVIASPRFFTLIKASQRRTNPFSFSPSLFSHLMSRLFKQALPSSLHDESPRPENEGPARPFPFTGEPVTLAVIGGGQRGEASTGHRPMGQPSQPPVLTSTLSLSPHRIYRRSPTSFPATCTTAK